MAKNLKAQLNYAIQSCFKGNGQQSGGYGASKHSDMASGQKNGKIYSWSSYHGRLETACQFASFVRENYPNVRNANQLTAEMAESFLLSKAGTCTTETIDTYRSNLASLGENINRTYASAHVNLKVGKVVGKTANQESRCKAMTSADIATLRDSYRPGSTGYKAVTIAEHTGCRASEIVKLKPEHISIQGTTASVLIVQGKGNRSRTIQISDPAGVRALTQIKASTAAGERIVPCKTGSIQKSINRHMKALSGSSGGNMKENYCMTNIHSIRKNFAQREFDRARQSGCSRQESLDRVSAQLGHGAGRDLATLQRYVENIY